jgi:RHS repeat-associated protein
MKSAEVRGQTAVFPMSSVETSLYYYRARYYDPGAGRFISEDIIRFAGGVEFYAYVHNNSANLTDPLGLCGPTVSHCLGVAAAAKGLSIGLDILGAIPAVGNATSAASGLARAGIAVNHLITSPAFALGSGAYGASGAVSAGPEDPTDSIIGAASGGAGIGLALADASLGGTKAIPIVGNFVSVATLGWDGYQAYKKYQSCMAGQ